MNSILQQIFLMKQDKIRLDQYSHFLPPLLCSLLGLPKNFYRFMTYLWSVILEKDLWQEIIFSISALPLLCLFLANFMVCILTSPLGILSCQPKRGSNNPSTTCFERHFFLTYLFSFPCDFSPSSFSTKDIYLHICLNNFILRCNFGKKILIILPVKQKYDMDKSGI